MGAKMKIVLASLNFAPAHASYLEACYEICSSLGYETAFLVESSYDALLAPGIDIRFTSVSELVEWKPDVVLFCNIGLDNFRAAHAAQSCGASVLYVLHEPYPGFSELMKERSRAPKAFAASTVNAILAQQADCVVLPSKSAYEVYERYSLGLNRNYRMLPLVLPDRYDPSQQIEREYFSFIGTFCESHARDEFLAFVHDAIKVDHEIKFMIATSTNINSYLEKSELASLVSSGRLVVRHGAYLTNAEIDRCYRKSICTWAVYNRSTQSGVVTNAMMQGSPVIARDLGNMAQDVENGVSGILLPAVYSNSDVLEAWRSISSAKEAYSAGARKVFRERHWSLAHKEAFANIVEEAINA